MPQSNPSPSFPPSRAWDIAKAWATPVVAITPNHTSVWRWLAPYAAAAIILSILSIMVVLVGMGLAATIFSL